MKTIDFKDFAKGNNVTYNINRLIKYCKENGVNEVTFPKDIYEIDSDYCSERLLCISNHGENEPKRIVFDIDSMSDFTIDFGGSVLLCHDVVTPVAISNSKNITVKNMILKNTDTRFMQAKVVAHGEDYIDLYPEIGGEQYSVKKGILYVPLIDALMAPATHYIEFNGETGEIETDTADYTVGNFDKIFVEKLPDGNLRFKNVTRKAPVGNRLILQTHARSGAGVFAEYSENVTLQNIEVRSCYGMGFIGQVCENITLDNFSTRRHDNQFYTSNADATHFVNCTGLVTVQNCTFEGQHDDALNIHGMYTRIIDKTATEVFVKEVHYQATGIKIFKEGDRLAVVEVESLIPYAEKTIKAVDYINNNVVKLTLNETTDDITVGDDIENISRNADLLFCNNIVRNNRARGMLLATKGKTVIENCYFHTAGSSINFEANGNYWFESGSTKDVTIRNNTFDLCKKSCGWGLAVIVCIKRQKTLPDKYYHQKIRVVDNTFNMYRDTVATFDNIDTLEFSGNTVNNVEGVDKSILLVSHVKNHTIQPEVNAEITDV